jgi:hypothetical protein
MDQKNTGSDQMLNKIKHLSLLIFLCIQITACAGVDPNGVENLTPTNGASPIPYTPPNPLVTKDWSLTLTTAPTTIPTITAAPLAIVSSTAQHEYSLIPECSAGGRLVPLDDTLEIPGVIFYELGRSYYGEGLFALNGASLNSTMLTETAEQLMIFHGVSPDGDWLAFSPVNSAEEGATFNSPIMILLSSDGERLEVPVDVSQFIGEKGTQGYFEDFARNGYWINQELLYLELISLPLQGTIMSYIPKVFNPFESTWQGEWINSLPERYEIMPARMRGAEIGIAPDLSRVVYPAVDRGIILYDLQTNTVILKHVDFEHSHKVSIRWSPDGSYVAVGNHLAAPYQSRSPLILISRDGKIIKEIVNGKPSHGLGGLQEMAWSRDGRYLAHIHTSHLDSIPYEMIVYDTAAGLSISRCPLFEMDQIGNLFWSPDNQWIGIQGFDAPLRVMNVGTGEVVELRDEGRIVGWTDQFLMYSNK